MNKKLIITLVLAIFGCTGLFAQGVLRIVQVQCEKDKGEVFVSQTELEPDEIKYTDKKAVTCFVDPNGEDFYGYARPFEGYEFKYWLDPNGNVIEGNRLPVPGGKDGEQFWNAYTFTAIFEKIKEVNDGVVKVQSSDDELGTVSIDNPENQIGDKVTITAALLKAWPGGMGVYRYSKSHKFVGWFDSKGNLVTEDTKFTVDVTEPETYTARFSWTPFMTGKGYYRVRYSYNQQFWKLTGSYDPTPAMFGSHESRKIDGVLDLSRQNDFSNPACIMKLDATSFNLIDKYRAQVVVADGLSLESQGVSTANILQKFNLKLQTCHNVGFYKVVSGGNQIAASEHSYGSEANPNLGYLYVNTDQTGKEGSDPDSYFEFEPVDEEHVNEFYFGAQPDESMSFEGGYWTSMYTSFPYECYAPDGVEAYYISEIAQPSGMSIAVLNKIESGKVPAFTAVLLKCKGLTPKENRLIPLWDDEEALSKNLLKGEFQLNQSKADPAHTTFDGKNMRVFGVNKSGELGFYKLEEGTELAANKAWLDLSGLANTNAAKIVIRSDVSGIESIEAEEADPANVVIYDIQGRRVLNPVKGEIYIINGSKRVY